MKNNLCKNQELRVFSVLAWVGFYHFVLFIDADIVTGHSIDTHPPTRSDMLTDGMKPYFFAIKECKGFVGNTASSKHFAKAVQKKQEQDHRQLAPLHIYDTYSPKF